MLHNKASERLVEGYERKRNAGMKAEIKAHLDKTLGELKEERNLPCSESRLSRIVREKPGVQRKKKVIAPGQERRRCAGKA